MIRHQSETQDYIFESMVCQEERPNDLDPGRRESVVEERLYGLMAGGHAYFETV